MNKELLTEILDSVTAVHVFITADLTRESLSVDCDMKRQKFSQMLEDLCDKIRSSHPSIRPRMNTPSSKTGGKPPPPVPQENLELTEEEEEGEMYTEFDPSGGVEGEPENYLEFEPSQTSGDLSQEVYEAMNPEDQDDVYEEPRPGPPEEQSDLYEDPTSSDTRPSTSSSLHVPTPSQSRENSASGAEHIEATRERAQLDRSSILGDMSVDWSTIYSPPSKGSNAKINTLKGISIKGILEKLGGRNKKTWQRRYCVMAGPLMYFYEKESSKSYNNYICLPSFSVSLAPNMTNEKKKQFAFKLSQQDKSTGKSKDYYFRAISPETREKWVSAIEKTLQTSPSPFGVSATLPRMPSSNPIKTVPEFLEKRRTASVGDDADQELYEDMAEPIKEESEEEDNGDYLPVSPLHENDVEELTSSAEYVDVKPGEEMLEEEYEDTTAYQTDIPPPPLSPPPGPPTSHPLPSPEPPLITAPPNPPLPARDSPPSRKPAPPPPVEPTVNTDKIYTQGSNGVVLKKVFVVVWDFDAQDKDELSLSRGDLVFVGNPTDKSDWWFGELLDGDACKKLGKNGLFPREYSDLAFEAV